MLLTKKTILIILGIMVPFIVIVYFLMDNIFFNGFANLEKSETEKSLVRGENAIEARLSSLDSLTEDWANWDDTYFYAQNEDPAYIDNNMMDQTFSSIRLNLMMIFNQQDRLLFSKAYDFNQSREIPIPAELQTKMFEDEFPGILDGQTLSGIVLTAEYPLLIVSKPILDNYGEGPAMGIIVTGIIIDKTMIEEISETTDLSFTVYRINDPASPADFIAAGEYLIASQSSYILPMENNRIGGYGLLMDIYKNPALVFKVDLPRNITTEGRRVIGYINTIFLGLSVIFIVLFIFILRRLIISRIITLDKTVQTITKTGDTTRRIVVPGQDELSHLSLNINSMLTSLEQADREVKALYEQEKKHREELEIEADARTQFINVLAHELRTPLTPLLVSVEMIQEMYRSKPGSIQFKIASTALSSVNALRSRLEELLDLARFSRGAIKLNLHLIDTSAFLEAAVLRYMPAFVQKRQNLLMEIPSGLPAANADTSRIEQVIINLLSNAGKYSPMSSTIVFRASVHSENLLVEVEDEGIGVPPEEQSKLFTPYHRAQQDRQSYPGIGLGLAVSSQIVQAHGGKIWVESQRGKGSTFKFTLPLYNDQPEKQD
jgi:signal transduction histidine kinase